jgi:glycosyltransferase involved in cell wall biosynthesis
MRILFTCGREPEYQRNAVIRAALARHFDVISITDSSHNLPLRYLRIAWHLLKVGRIDFDLMFVGFLGQPLMPLVRRLTRKPILLDAFLSVYDTLCFDRRTFTPQSAVGRMAFWLDRASCAYADQVLLDTQAHADYFQHTFGVPENKLQSLFVGCDDKVFYPRQSRNTPPPLVLYYGSFLPLQGIDVVVRAAKLLEGRSNAAFRIIGTGIETARIRMLVSELDVRNVTFLPSVPLEQLPGHIQEATICLGGQFGASAKAARVIAGKTFQCIAMGRPTIVGDNAANQELLRHGHDAWFCKMNDPEALAEAILHLISDPKLCAQLGGNAYHTFMERASIQALSGQLKQIVESMIG